MNEFKTTKGPRGRVTFTDPDGDQVSVEKAMSADHDVAGCVYVNARSSGHAYVSARELIEAVAEIAGLRVSIESVLKDRSCITDQFGEPEAYSEKPLDLLVELYSEQAGNGASNERLAITMERIHRQVAKC